MRAMNVAGLLAVSIGLSLPVASYADSKASGPNEFAGRISYTDVDYGSFDSQETQVELAYGRYLTDMHEVGVGVGYFKQEIEGESLDGSTLGVFYHLNFPMSGSVTPYIGVNAAWIGGDLGDAFDLQYGASVGMKIYPFEHAGVSIGVTYQKLNAAESYIEDADGLSVGVGLLIRF